MKKIADFIHIYLKQWQVWLVIILIACTFTRFWQLGNIKEYVFDEVYHAFTAKMYALNRYEAWVWWTTPPEGVAYEWTHPPLAKVVMSWGILLFGGPGEMPNKDIDPATLLTPSSFGWRFFPAVFGVLGTFALFLFTKSIFRNAWIGIFAAFLFTFDLLPLVQSRTAMNDIFAVTFILFTFYFFTKREGQQDGIHYPSHLLNHRLPLINWLLTGLFLGAAIASKWTSLFTIGLLGFYHFTTLLYHFFITGFSGKPGQAISYVSNFVTIHGKLLLQNMALGLVSMVLIPFAIYVLSYWQLFTLPITDKEFDGNKLNESLVSMRSRKEYLEGNISTDQAEAKKQKDEINFLGNEISFFETIQPYNYHLSERFFIWWGLQKQMWWYHTNLKATHGYTSQWWTWPLDIRPVWFYVKYCGINDQNKDLACIESLQATRSERTIADIYTMGNPIIFWLIIPLIGLLGYIMADRYKDWLYAIIPASIILLIQVNFTIGRSAEQQSLYQMAGIVAQQFAPQLLLFGFLLLIFIIFLQLVEYANHYIQHKKLASTETGLSFSIPFKEAVPLFLCLIIFAGYWLPWARSPRIMFFYHFFPPVTFFYPLLAYYVYRIYQNRSLRKYVFWMYMSLVVLSFIYFYPHVTGMLVSESMREQYFWLPSWK